MNVFVGREALRYVALQVGLFAVVVMMAVPLAAQAGHTFGGGDCWRAGTPYDCRTSWNSGTHHTIFLRIINQLNNSTLWNAANTGCNNWNNAPGPQYCHNYAITNDSWVYFKRDDRLTAPNGYNWQCIPGACPHAVPVDAQWSEDYVTIGNNNFGGISISVDAHEMGHALGLDHHGVQGSNVALMTQGTTRQSPNSIDIGPLPACSTVPVGSNGSGGVRCVYDGTF